MAIRFPFKPGICTHNSTVVFHALVDGEFVSCEISEEALHDHFGAKTNRADELVACFEAGRDCIHEVARRRLTVDAGRKCLLVTADFN